MLIDGVEIGVIYMRCGYHPDQYPTERTEMETLLLRVFMGWVIETFYNYSKFKIRRLT